MKMSIARALKERKRIIGEMNTVRQRINGSNRVQVMVRADKDGNFKLPTKDEVAAKRRLCPAKLMDEWYALRDRLIQLKVALHSANTGIVESLARLSELKSELTEVEGTPGYDSAVEDANDMFKRVTDVVFDNEWRLARTDELRGEINELQDSIDEYNATHYVDVAEPTVGC